MWLVLFIVIFLLPIPAHAATYWVNQTGGAANCADILGADDPLQYMTMAEIDAQNCGAPADTIIVKAGTYTGTHIPFTNLVPSGSSPTNRSKVICEGDRTCIIRFGTTTVAPVRTGNIQMESAVNFILGERRHGFVSDCINGGSGCRGIHFRSLATDGVQRHITVEGNEVINHHGNGISFTEFQPTQYYTNVTVRWNKVGYMDLPINTSSGDPHAIYMASRDSLVEHNEIFSNYGYGIQCWHIATNMVIRYNHVTTNDVGSGITCQDSETQLPTNNAIHDNVFISADNLGTCLYFRGNSQPVKMYNNTCIGYATFYATFNGAGNTSELKNNVCTGVCARTIAAGTSINCGGTCTVTNPTVTASSHFRNAAAGDVSLIAGSSLINSGLDVGLLFNGSAPDIGAHASFGCTTASINTTNLDLTCTMSARTPIQPTSGVTGWSIGCTGVGCGIPTVSNVSVPTGSSTLIRLSISGITGGDCAVGQTWTISYSDATGTVTDTAAIGGIYHQRLHSFTNLTVLNSCTGSTDPGPSNPHVYYKFNGDGSDASPNVLHATLTGTEFVSARYGQGLKTHVLQADHAAIPFGNAINPSTQSLTIAGGVFVDGADLSSARAVFGSTLGGTNQRLYITRQVGTWRIGIQAYAATSASEFSVQPGWNHLCLVMNSATDTATLHVNGVAGVSAGAVQAYPSYTLAGDFKIGLPTNFATSSGGEHIFDEWRIYTSLQSCGDLYAAWEPNTSPWAGSLSAVSFRFYAAKSTPESVVIPLADVDTNITIPAGGAFTVAMQTDGTIADPSAISERLYYSCVACASAGTDLPVPNIATTDGLEFWGPTTELGLLGGAHGVNISGALAHVNGGTNLTADSIPVFDLAQNNSTVMRWTMRIASGTPQGRQFCMKPREQSGLALNGYTPSSGACVTVGPPVAHNSF